jgi:hypothetical protein
VKWNPMKDQVGRVELRIETSTGEPGGPLG